MVLSPCPLIVRWEREKARACVWPSVCPAPVAIVAARPLSRVDAAVATRGALSREARVLEVLRRRETNILFVEEEEEVGDRGSRSLNCLI